MGTDLQNNKNLGTGVTLSGLFKNPLKTSITKKKDSNSIFKISSVFSHQIFVQKQRMSILNFSQVLSFPVSFVHFFVFHVLKIFTCASFSTFFFLFFFFNIWFWFGFLLRELRKTKIRVGFGEEMLGMILNWKFT